MSERVGVLMLSSDEGLWVMYDSVFGRKGYLIKLLPPDVIGQSKEAIEEADLIILDIPSAKNKWIRKIRAVRSIIRRSKPLIVVSNLESKSVAKVLDAGADECLPRMEEAGPFRHIVLNLLERYRYRQQ